MSLLSQFQNQFAIPVLRETRSDYLENMALSIAEGGLSILEITLMSEEAFGVIEKLSKKTNLLIGAGTVLSETQAKQAIDAGAKFLVSPGLNAEALKFAHSQNIPFYPGVLTPTEILIAKNLGCDLVKIFPISAMGGAQYLRSLQGPYPQMKWMATGGVSMQDFKSLMGAGATCVGLGNQMTPTEIINAKNWSALTALAELHVQAVKEAR